jgi:glycosyltransferase involved in cell wall biosynthesis
LRIALFTETFLPAVDGVVTRLRYTIEALSRAGEEIMVFAPAGGPPSYAGAEVFPVPGIPFPLYPEKRLAPPHPGVRRALWQFRPDVIHAANPVVLAAGGVYYARRLGVPLVASYHTNIPAYARHYGFPFAERILWSYVRALHNRAQVNLCTSRATQRELSRRGVKRVEFWPQGVDTGRFNPSRASAEWRERLSAGHPEHKILLYVGRVAPEKQLERLRPVLESFGEVCLAVVGDGPARRDLERALAGTATVFPGTLHGEELAAAYASSDIFVFPSTTETLGLAMLEALASGLPVVAAGTGATGEVVEDGANGLLYDPESDESLIRTVGRLVEDDSLRSEMSRAARRAAERRSWKNATRSLCEIYQKARSAAGSRARKRGPAFQGAE